MNQSHYVKVSAKMAVPLSPAGCSKREDKGIALVMTLLFLSLVSLAALAMVLSTSSDMLINGYYRNTRGSFYAADSGLNIARQQLVNQINAQIPATFTIPPIPAGAETTALSNVRAADATFTDLRGGRAAGSWVESFKMSADTASCTNSFALAGGTNPVIAGRDGSGNPNHYIYTYNYTLCITGQAQGTAQATVAESGSVTFDVTGAPSTTTVSFASYGMFIDQWAICSGGSLVPGTISGPVFTNGAWTFGYGGAYTFTDTVQQVGANAGFQFSSRCDQANASSDSYRGQTIAPAFQNGFSRNQAARPLPSNSFSQERAVLDGLGTSSAAVTPSDLHSALKDLSGTAYPASGASSGVYLPYTSVGGTNTVNGGGIYVEGDATVTLSTSGSSAQVFTITQGSSITTVTIDKTANTTTVNDGTSTLTLAGVPMDKAVSPAQAATMLYVNGNITSLQGPGEGVPAIQDGAAVTVTANNNITITGDILYKTEPVTTQDNQIPGSPADTLIPGNDKGQSLGLFTANPSGNIILNNQQTDGNLEIDASVATISNGGSGGLVNTGAQIQHLVIVGGRIQNQIKNINAVARDVFFDKRFAPGSGEAPPWFPSTTFTTTGASVATSKPSFQRVQWLNTTGSSH